MDPRFRSQKSHKHGASWLWEGLMLQDSQSRSGNLSAMGWMHPLGQLLGKVGKAWLYLTDEFGNNH